MDDRIQTVFSSFKGKKEELIPLLQEVQKEFGYLPDEGMMAIAEFLRIPESRVYGAATFYAQFRFTPKGKKHIMVCRGTACHVKGAVQIIEGFERKLGIKEGETTDDGEYSLETVACIGCCSLAPTLMIDNKVEANMTPEKVEKVLKKGKNHG